MNSYYWTRLIGWLYGWLYGWDTTNVVRWQYGAETVEVVLDFLHSGISGQKVTLVRMLDDKYFSNQTTTDNGTHQALHLYEKAPDKDLSQMTVLTVAAVQLPEELEAAILDFHATHDDYYIRTVSYEQYNTADEPDKGYQLFMTDLTTGILQADILYGSTYDAIDLYPLMTGDVQKEDIAPAVRRSLEVDGKLTSIGPTFRVSTLVGKTGVVPERFTLSEFLDYAEGLSADEHLMEEMGWQNADSMLFGNAGYASFLQNGKATFDDPLFTRLLTFLSTLSENGEKYMDEGVDNSNMVLAGEISEAQLQVESGGENLYWNGKIKFTWDPLLNTPNQLLKQYARFGTTGITLPGYPTVADENGVRVSCGGIYAITNTCQSPAVAWEFIESILQNAAELPVTDLQGNVNLRESFTTLTKPYMDYLENLRGLRMVVTEGNKFYAGMDVDEKGQYMGKPGMVLEVGDALIEDIRWIYEEAGGLHGYSSDIYQIVWEEVSRYLAGGCDAATCAQAVQSRVGLYLAENS